MFHSRRSALVKRIQRTRTKYDNETASEVETVSDYTHRAPATASGYTHRAPANTTGRSPRIKTTADRCVRSPRIKSLQNSLLKRLSDAQLEVLAQCLELQGSGDYGPCVRMSPGLLKVGTHDAFKPHVLAYHVWRCPRLHCDAELKALPCCSASRDGASTGCRPVCINPFHWSRILTVPDSPPPYKTNGTGVESNGSSPGSFSSKLEQPVSTETGLTPLNYTCQPGGDSSTPQRQPYWCHIAYWELRQRVGEVGRLFPVHRDNVSVFQESPHGDGMCLQMLQASPETEAVKRTREKIGLGISLSREGDNVWLYNNSEYPVFVNSPVLDCPTTKTFTVHRVPSGFSLNIFDYNTATLLQSLQDAVHSPDGPVDANAIRISFVKGWGGSYSRQIVTSCPCWLEVLLNDPNG